MDVPGFSGRRALIGLAYFFIPVAILDLTRRR